MTIYLNMISTTDILYRYEIYDNAKTKVLAFIRYISRLTELYFYRKV